jgi:hypothetical protein
LTARPGRRRGCATRVGCCSARVSGHSLLLPAATARPATGIRLERRWPSDHRLDRLGTTRSSGAKSAVSAVLRKHPDFERWQERSKDADADRAAFLEASTWPDDIRRDRRFYTAGHAPPTPTLQGFPDMERRLAWHYVDRPLHPWAQVVALITRRARPPTDCTSRRSCATRDAAPLNALMHCPG